MIGGSRTRTLDGIEYGPGKKFRVLAPCRLSGMEPAGRGSYRGWAKSLEPGDVIECAGFGPGWGSDPGYGVHWLIEGIAFVRLVPETGGPWAFRPRPDLIEPVVEP